MMMTEKYYTLPGYSTTYHSPNTNRVCSAKNRLYIPHKKSSTSLKSNKMKLLIEQQPKVRTQSLFDVQERIDYFEKRKEFDDEENQSNGKTLNKTYINNESYGSTLSRAMMNSVQNGKILGKRRSLSSSQLVHFSDQQKISGRYTSALSNRTRTYSLSNHSTMAMTAVANFSEEQITEPQEITSIDFENTYFYPEETTRFDDVLSLTTITSNVQFKPIYTQHDISVSSDTTMFQSDTEENSEQITSSPRKHRDKSHLNTTNDSQNENIKNNNEEIIRIRLSLTPSAHDFTGVVHAKKCTVIKENEYLSEYDNVNHDNKIRSIVDNVLLTKSTIEDDHSRGISIDEQLCQQEKQTNEYVNSNDDDDVCIEVNPNEIAHSIKMNNDAEMIKRHVNENDNDDNDDDDDDEHYSDESHYSNDIRYSSNAAHTSCTSDDLNNTSSTLRQEAISITRVRCKKRKTWIRSPSSPTQAFDNNPKSYLQQRRLKANLIQPFLSNNQVDETDARQNASVNLITTTKSVTSTASNRTRVKEKSATMLLHNDSLTYNQEKPTNGETSYKFHSVKPEESIRVTTSTTFNKDALSPKSSDDKSNKYLQSTLSPVKRLLNDSIDSNIEIVQMDEQECIFEIVDGVLTIVPKDKSTSSSSSIVSNGDKAREQKLNQYNTSKNFKHRPSSVASSVSTPSLSEHEQERDELSSGSYRSSSKPILHSKDLPTIKTSNSLQVERSNDMFDLFSTPIASNNSMKQSQKTLLDDSLSSVSSYGDRPAETKKKQSNSSIPRSSSPINKKSSNSPNKDKISPTNHFTKTSHTSIENQTHLNKTNVLSQLLQTVKKAAPNDEIDIEKLNIDYPIPKSTTLPPPKPINKDRINEFATLLSSSVHLSQPKPTKKSLSKPKTSPARSEDQSFSSVPSASTDREERESYHTITSNSSEQEQTKRHIDARYNERLDDRGSIKINTANIKALFEQKISETNRTLSQSSEHLTHTHEIKHQHKKIPVSYGSLKKSTSNQATRRLSAQDSSTMNKYSDNKNVTKDVVIEHKKIEHTPNAIHRRNTVEPVCPSESLIAREIRETREKEEELRRQRQKNTRIDDEATVISHSINDSIKSESLSTPISSTIKNSSFLSNLDFFTSKTNYTSNESSSTTCSPRRPLVLTQNVIYDSHNSSSNRTRQTSNDELKQIHNVVSQELNRFSDNGVPIIRTSSTNGPLQRATSNQNILSPQNPNNIIQREIELIRAKEVELRQLGRIQHTSDEHADPRKYQELVSTLPKSQSVNTIPTGKSRRDSGNQQISRHNGLPKGKTTHNNNNSSMTSVRGKYTYQSPNTPIVNSVNKSSIDYSKLSTTDRLELEKRQCQEREQELKKQRNSGTTSISSINTTINGDSGNVSQEEQDDDQERYLDKIERIKRTENEKAQAPLMRPIKKLDMSHKWEQMRANKIDD